LPGFRAEDISLSNIRITFEGGGSAEMKERDIAEIPEAYPEHNMFGMLPSYGFYCRHCKNIRFDNIELGYDKPEARPAFIFDDVEDIQLQGLMVRTAISVPAIQFSGVSNALIQSCTAGKGTETFLNLRGMENLHVSLTGNDLSYCKLPVSGDNTSTVFLDANRMPPY